MRSDPAEICAHECQDRIQDHNANDDIQDLFHSKIILLE